LITGYWLLALGFRLPVEDGKTSRDS